MKFWDSSAIVPLCSDEPTTDAVRAVLTDDPEMIVSFLTPIEVASALRRRREENEIVRARAGQRFNSLRATWAVIDDYAAIVARAETVVARHPLRGSDVIQLASALQARSTGADFQFVTNDAELRTAALAEGFTVLPESPAVA